MNRVTATTSRRTGHAVLRRVALSLTVVASLLAATVPTTIAPSDAAWTDTEWVQGAGLGTDLLACGIDAGYSTTASARFLSASLAGAALDPIAGENGLQAWRVASSPATVSPSMPGNQVDANTDTFTNPLTVSVLDQGLINLTGLNAGLPVGAAGALASYAQVTSTGSSAAASGLISDSGGIGFTPSTADAQLPTAALLDLASVLPAGVAGASLSIGAVAASAQLDWCAALESRNWGDKSNSGVIRDYEIASLDLVLQMPALTSVLTSATDAVTTFVNSLAGAGNAAALLAAPIGTDSMTVDLEQGTVTIDLESLLSAGLNDQPPNTVLSLDAAKVATAIAQVTDLVTAWTDAIATELQNAKSLVSGLLTLLLGTLNAALNSLSGVVNTTVPTLTPTLNGVFDVLPQVLSLTVNVQNEPPPETGATSAEYRVSALRIGLLDSGTASELATVTLATASVGANARLP